MPPADAAPAASAEAVPRTEADISAAATARRIALAAHSAYPSEPRTRRMAEALQEAGVVIDAVVAIAVPDEAIVRRLSGRRSHPGSGRVYHVVFNPPRVEGRDDVTGEPLVQRDDDREETIRRRLATYHAQTAVLGSFYRALAEQGAAGAPALIVIDGTQSIDAVRQSILGALDSLS